MLKFYLSDKLRFAIAIAALAHAPTPSYACEACNQPVCVVQKSVAAKVFPDERTTVSFGSVDTGQKVFRATMTKDQTWAFVYEEGTGNAKWQPIGWVKRKYLICGASSNKQFDVYGNETK